MRKLLFGMLVLIAMTATSGRASAWQYGYTGPWATSVVFPLANPPGWYTNTYWYAWQYPWFAYYNYSHGPYANWMAGGGYAGYNVPRYGYPMYHGVMAPAQLGGKSASCTLTINLPTDAKLLFNGSVANGTGNVRTFTTPLLEPGMDYAYDLTVEVTRDGQTERATKQVVVRAGEKTSVTLAAGVVNVVGTR
ncbi:MAG: TIGR03000 domain-containing protein [Planctomycetes bacterium]|nr:TIGR03000 domain-containing protein [Planctomycetota bacterium]